MAETSTRRLLISVLGTRANDRIYELSGCTCEASLAPIALLALESFDEVIALCTDEAKQTTLPILESGAGSTPITPVGVPPGVGHDEIGQFLEAFTNSLSEGSQVAVDITHGFRHLSFLTLMGALYASTLGRTDVRSAYYALERDRPEPSLFVDLSPLLELTAFLYAARVLRERGDPQPLADELVRTLSESKVTQSKVTRELTALSHAYASALPLELGRHAGLFLRDQLKPFRRELARRRLPLVPELVEEVQEGLTGIALPVAPGQGWKRHTHLDKEELHRQARVIDELLRRQSLGPALVLMEEWLISWACLRLGLMRRWLERDARERGASALHALATISDSESASPTAEQRQLAQFWSELVKRRNAYAHAGMRPEEVVGTLDDELLTGWETLKHAPAWPLDFPASAASPILVSAVGTTPGPLYSALRACPTDPGYVIAICSRESRPHAQEALSRYESKAALIPLTMHDPIAGKDEIDSVVKEAARHLLASKEVFVNLTGGTTLMGLIVEQIARAAERRDRTVRRFGLIDRRPREQQLAEPFVAAEPYWLDSREDDE